MPPREPAGLGQAEADISQLIQIWISALDAFVAVTADLSDTDWRTPSPCPGWSVGDIVAHVTALESELHGEPIPVHEPDWGSLPHVVGPISQYTELPVDWRRSRSRDEITAELREVIEWRRDDLSLLPPDPMTGPGGWVAPADLMIRTRILDTWMHEQDVRQAIGQPGGLDSTAAWVTADRLIVGLPYVWAKGAGAPIGSTLSVAVRGPGVEFSRSVIVGENGRARFSPEPPDESTVTLRCPWSLYNRLAGGRIGAVADARSGGVEIAGDRELAERLLPALAVTP